MRQTLAVIACLLFSLFVNGDEVSFGPGMSSSNLGGLIIVRQGGQTTISLGGILFPRHVKTKTATPEGPVVTRFKLPAVIHSPYALPFLEYAPATILVDIPDEIGLLYLNGELLTTTGTTRQLESPPLAPGQSYSLKIRGAFKVGDHLLIEDRTLLLRAGESNRVSFDGKQAVAVRLGREVEVVPAAQSSK